ncbi:MAG: carbohydrate binding domain-containing protein [Hyalangium sp.]|uniref:carbohydrate binding domain-containing protein n=1 Tax=Hyalangium sp. TaxID=2028555 RepID=UPI00389A5C5F
MNFTLRNPWWLCVLALVAWQGCGGEPKAPIIGPNLVVNGTFESTLEEGWWTATDSKAEPPEKSSATTSPDAADSGSAGLMLHKGPDGFYSMVGQTLNGHGAWQTFQVHARIKGTTGNEHVIIGYDSQSVEVVAETRWRTVSRLLLMSESSDDSNLRISLTTNDSTVYVDEVSLAMAQVERGDAEMARGNLLRNSSFESGLSLWDFFTSAPEGTASTSPDARHSGYAGLVLNRGPEGTITLVKQPLPDPVAEREEYRIEADVRGAHGGESVNLCLQIDHDPWTGPCITVTTYENWQHISQKLPIDETMLDERVGVVISPGSDGSVMVDDVILTRTQR